MQSLFLSRSAVLSRSCLARIAERALAGRVSAKASGKKGEDLHNQKRIGLLWRLDESIDPATIRSGISIKLG
jgi:hypothetical protein